MKIQDMQYLRTYISCAFPFKYHAQMLQQFTYITWISDFMYMCQNSDFLLGKGPSNTVYVSFSLINWNCGFFSFNIILILNIKMHLK